MIKLNNQIPGLLSAIQFATIKHGDQKRKYTGEPYIVHCLSVAKLLIENHADEPCLSVAILHDTIEDTATTFEELEKRFGTVIAQIVLELTDPPLSAGNRAKRKQITRDRLATASYYAKTVKCADIIDNMESIVKHDPHFAKVFMDEVRATYPLLSGGMPLIYALLGEKIAGVKL